MIAGLLLAAGQSRRMGGGSKLLLPIAGKTLVRRAAETLLAAELAPVLVVVGQDPEAVRRELAGLPLGFVENPRYADGMASSIVAGVSALGDAPRAVAIALGDMPRTSPDTVRALLRAFAASGKGIAVPVHGSRRGHPVVFDLREYRHALLALDGDAGARSVLATHSEDVLEVPVDDPGVLIDVDTPEDYEREGPAGRR